MPPVSQQDSEQLWDLMGTWPLVAEEPWGQWPAKAAAGPIGGHSPPGKAIGMGRGNSICGRGRHHRTQGALSEDPKQRWCMVTNLTFTLDSLDVLLKEF